MGSLPFSVHAYRVFFEGLLASNGKPLVFHCTAGDDRTGWAAYLVERILGVPQKTAIDNYLKSNVVNAAELKGYMEYFMEQGFTRQQSDFKLRKEYLFDSLKAAKITYGSFSRYVHVGLGLSQQDIEALKAEYLS
jgi:protein-tyrosine phosphatase